MYSKDQIISEIRRVAAMLGQDFLTGTDFSKHAKISKSTVGYYFGSYNNAIKMAGLKPVDPAESIRHKEIIADEILLSDLLRLEKEHGKEPTLALVNAEGKFSVRPYMTRWGSVHQAFLIAKKNLPSEFGPSEIKSFESPKFIAPTKADPVSFTSSESKKKRIVFGEPINFRGLRFAPINEQGVVYLFGMISQELGYLIESVRTAYPDCEGKRCFDKEGNQWEHVQIEFEYKSSNFREHGHNPDQCNVIVCWVHDWKECPADIDVVELKSAIKYLRS
jgi:hypothetical protein